MSTGEIEKVEPDVYEISELTPDALRAQVKIETELRTVIVKYMKDQMLEGHHYLTDLFPGQKKPYLCKEGALNLCSLFKARPDTSREEYIPLKDGHFSLVFKCVLRGKFDGQIKGVGYGECRTIEPAYLYQWVWMNEVNRLGLELSDCKTRKTKDGLIQYQVLRENIESYNTIMKKAEKRAIVDAVLKLPLVSELFTQDEDLHTNGNDKPHSPRQPSDKQIKRLIAIQHGAGYSDDEFKPILLKKWGLKSRKLVTLEHYDEICKWLEDNKKAPVTSSKPSSEPKVSPDSQKVILRKQITEVCQEITTAYKGEIENPSESMQLLLDGVLRMMEVDDIKQASDEQLQSILNSLEVDLMTLRDQNAQGKTE